MASPQSLSLGLCRCKLTDILDDKESEGFMTQAHAITRSRQHFATSKDKLSITNSIKANELSAKKGQLKTPTKLAYQVQKIADENKPPVVSDFWQEKKCEQTKIPLEPAKNFVFENNIMKTQPQRSISYQSKPPLQNYLHTITIKKPKPLMIPSLQLMKPTSQPKSTILTPRIPKPPSFIHSLPQTNSAQMLFTSYLNRETMESSDAVGQSLNTKTADNSTKESQMTSRQKHLVPITQREEKGMKLREVESQYAESIHQDSHIKKSIHTQSKYISKLEKFIPQPKRAIQSLIVKDQRFSVNVPQTKSRFTKSVLGQNSRIEQKH